MSETNGSGIQYPTLELGGKTYVVKFTRGALLYRLGRKGLSFEHLMNGANFATIIDFLHAALSGQYQGTEEDLADVVLNEGKTLEVGAALAEAVKKASPSDPNPAAEPAGQPAPPVQ